VLSIAIPAFADKGALKGTGAGHTSTDFSGDCKTFQSSCTIDRTSSGKEGNLEGGPGHTTDQSFINPEAIQTPATLLSEETTSSGHTADGGGRRTSEFIVPGDFKSPDDFIVDENCVGSDSGEGAPGVCEPA